MTVPARRTLADRIEHALGHPEELHPSVARAIANVDADRSRRALLGRLHRVLDARSPGIEPETSWAAPLGMLTIDQAEGARRAIEERWTSAPSRNSHVSALRAVVRAAWEQGAIDAEHRDRVLLALKPWPDQRPLHAAGRQVERGELREAFDAMIADGSPLAVRDAAMIGLMIGSGPRRSEVVGIDLEDYDAESGRLTLRATKGGRARTVYPPIGARRWLEEWIGLRGDEPGPLFLPQHKDRHRFTARRMSTGSVALVVAKRLGSDVSPHDLRHSFIGAELDAGADLSTVQRLAGHRNANTTAAYDRRGEVTKRDANALVFVPYRKEP